MVCKRKLVWDYIFLYGEDLAERTSQWQKMSITEREDRMCREKHSLEDFIRKQGGVEVIDCLEFDSSSKIYHYASGTIVISHRNPVRYHPTRFIVTIASNQPEEIIRTLPEPYNRIGKWNEYALSSKCGIEDSFAPRKESEL